MTTLREQIAQMLIMGFSGTQLENNPVKQWVRDDSIGGVLLFDYDLKQGCYGKNIVSLSQIKQLTTELHRIAHPRHPLFIAIDYEGGAVDRLKQVAGCPTTLSASKFAECSENELHLELHKMAITLKSLGFNLNFAPVVDLDLVKEQGIIGKLGRSFSSDYREVIRISRQFIKLFLDSGVLSCCKHFPGHGSALGDTHEGFVDVSDNFQLNELAPYRVLLEENLPQLVMTAHVVNRQLDPEGLPATLSKTMLTGILRKELGFQGVIVSDDLQMQAIAKHYSLEEALCLSINAGADMLIFANQLAEITPAEVITIVEYLVKKNKISSERIDQAFRRIMHLKHNFLIVKREKHGRM